MEYKIPIQRTKVKQKQVTSMHLIAGFMYIILGIFIWAVPNLIKNDTDALVGYIYQGYTIIGVILVLITIFLNKKLGKPSVNVSIRIIEVILFAFVALISFYKQWWVPFSYSGVGILAVLLTLRNEINASKPEYVTINENLVALPQNINNQIKWQDLRNFLLKHGNVTIDKRNNKLIQYSIKNPKAISNLQEIEDFAKKQIELNKDKYQADW